LFKVFSSLEVNSDNGGHNSSLSTIPTGQSEVLGVIRVLFSDLLTRMRLRMSGNLEWKRKREDPLDLGRY
jgi:hypothetical protein